MFASLVFLIAASALACPSGDQVGQVHRIERKSVNINATTPPRLDRDKSAQPATSPTLVEGAELCVGDSVTNPQDSGVNVELALNGNVALVKPGQTFEIRAPDITSWTTQLMARFSQLFSNETSAAPLLTRNARNAWTPLPRTNIHDIYVDPDAGPLVLAWPKSANGPFEIEVRDNEHEMRRSATIHEPFLTLNVSKYCRKGCRVKVLDDGALVKEFKIKALPGKQASLTDARALAVLGSDMQSRPATKWQGASLIWGAACALRHSKNTLSNLEEVLMVLYEGSYPALCSEAAALHPR
jgi:hypothetical protein